MEIVSPIDFDLQMTINRERYRMNPGDIAVVFPNEIHSFKKINEEGKLKIFIFSASLLKYHRNLLMHHHPENPVISAVAVHPNVRHVMDILLAELQKSVLNETVCTVLFELVIS
ncbi:MAG: AraC family ligand binding domain-containing protein [Oscillospiraceae bacterium]|nr:AraC family ligand binding domain-containing protein [Oscillospiraceae bacterium]